MFLRKNTTSDTNGMIEPVLSSLQSIQFAFDYKYVAIERLDAVNFVEFERRLERITHRHVLATCAALGLEKPTPESYKISRWVAERKSDSVTLMVVAHMKSL